MPTIKQLVARLCFILTMESLRIVLLLIFVLHLPIRLFNKLKHRRPHIPSPVSITCDTPSASHTLVFIHGFPDSPALWKETVSHLAPLGYRCLLVHLPGSSGEPVTTAPSPPEIVEQIRAQLGRYLTPGEKVTFVGHDWGAYFSLLFQARYPEIVERLVLVDVGTMSFSSDIHFTVWLCFFSYQSLLALFYLVGKSSRPLLVFLLRAWNYVGRAHSEVTIDMCHFYYATLKYMVQSRPTRETSTSTIPHLYMYGKRKPFMFHSEKWVSRCESSPHGKVVGLPCGHWVMIERHSEWIETVSKWLGESISA